MFIAYTSCVVRAAKIRMSVGGAHMMVVRVLNMCVMDMLVWAFVMQGVCDHRQQVGRRGEG